MTKKTQVYKYSSVNNYFFNQMHKINCNKPIQNQERKRISFK